jgi:hypothetical protein
MKMSTPPEVLFDRYLRDPARHPKDRLHYWGKKNLDALHTELANFLAQIQNALNEALKNEKRDVPEHVKHPPFHFDFIDSDVPNALAFCDAGYSFIGITMPLVSALWDSCVELSKSNAVGAILDVPETPEREEAILTVMCQTQLAFVVSHEFTHHVHGHLFEQTPGSPFFKEIFVSSEIGNMQTQAFEMDADGYAVFTSSTI